MSRVDARMARGNGRRTFGGAGGRRVACARRRSYHRMLDQHRALMLCGL